MDYSALVLTPWMTPHKIFSWHRSITAVLGRTANVLEEYDETVSAPSLTMQIPAVLQLRKHLARAKKDPKFSRHNVYVHYGFRCQYCGQRFRAKDLTYDHVVPRSRGGLTNWRNIVPACYRCNREKGSRTLAEAGMRLLHPPTKPESLPLAGLVALPSVVPQLWLPYLEGQRAVG